MWWSLRRVLSRARFEWAGDRVETGNSGDGKRSCTCHGKRIGRRALDGTAGLRENEGEEGAVRERCRPLTGSLDGGMNSEAYMNGRNVISRARVTGMVLLFLLMFATWGWAGGKREVQPAGEAVFWAHPLVRTTETEYFNRWLARLEERLHLAGEVERPSVLAREDEDRFRPVDPRGPGGRAEGEAGYGLHPPQVYRYDHGRNLPPPHTPLLDPEVALHVFAVRELDGVGGRRRRLAHDHPRIWNRGPERRDVGAGPDLRPRRLPGAGQCRGSGRSAIARELRCGTQSAVEARDRPAGR